MTAVWFWLSLPWELLRCRREREEAVRFSAAVRAADCAGMPTA